jgi:hypothetical protein
MLMLRAGRYSDIWRNRHSPRHPVDLAAKEQRQAGAVVSPVRRLKPLAPRLPHSGAGGIRTHEIRTASTPPQPERHSTCS